jgi:hypothetical protein
VTSPSESITKEQQEQRPIPGCVAPISVRDAIGETVAFVSNLYPRLSTRQSVDLRESWDRVYSAIGRAESSVPSQVEAAVKAERENCLNAALDALDSKTMRYEYCVNAGDAVTAAIRSRGETSL